MKLNNTLKTERILMLLKHDTFLSSKSILISFITLSAVTIVLPILAVITGDSEFSHLVNFSLILFIFGYVITAKSFTDMHSKERAYEWFMLPASMLEKFTAKLLISSIGWAFLFLIVYTLSALAGEGINSLIFNYRHTFFNPFDADTWFVILQYLITQSVFLFGAAYFKKNHFIKTILSLLTFVISIAIIAGLLGRIFFFQYFNEIIKPDGRFNSAFNFSWDAFALHITNLMRILAVSGKIVYYALFAPFFWLLTYFRITEKEVKNGV
ncbi:MAG: hypothetical protein GXP33_05830 [Spirochaetes bacterium]|nr:hypothetical protein [Spirochaetota bacterium]